MPPVYDLGPGNPAWRSAGTLPRVPTYPFLSDEWIAEARRIREEFHDETQPVTNPVRINQVITEVPFATGEIEAHIDTTSGELEMGLGHLEEPDVSMTLDYETAKAIFVDGTREAAMQAFMAGKIRVQGDLTKLIVAMQDQNTPITPGAGELARRIKEITG
jgi:putative sterol carrier protein